MCVRNVAIFVAIVIIFASASCDDRHYRLQPIDNNYRFSTGHVTEFGEHGSPTGYYTTIVQRVGEPPWLLVAKPLDNSKDGFVTESSTDSVDVTINGKSYSPRNGDCIVVLETPNGTRQKVYSVLANDSITKLSDGLTDLTVAEIDNLFRPLEEAEPSDATERRNRAF